MRLSVREIAKNKWDGILVALGFPTTITNGRHQPCPNCGGTDRFRFDNKDGNGTFYCSHCGPGNGVDLVMRVKDWDFKKAAEEIEKAAGFVKHESLKPAVSDEKKIASLRRMWKESFPVMPGDPVTDYLMRRGLIYTPSPVLRYHPSLFYREGDEVGRYQAMLALVADSEGSGVTLHRTYIKDGKKAPVSKAKKLMPGLPMKGAAIRLFPQEQCLGIAEGIETAIAAAMKFEMPVWAAVSAGGLESWIPPKGVTDVVVFADNDENMVGQKAGYALASRLAGDGIRSSVEIPSQVGTDWADCL